MKPITEQIEDFAELYCFDPLDKGDMVYVTDINCFAESLNGYESKIKAEAIREAIAEYIASHEAPDGCYQMAWFHGYADGIHPEDNSNE